MDEARQQPDVNDRLKRQRVVVDRKWQSAVATRVVGTGMSVVAIVQLGVMAMLTWGDVLESLSGTQLVVIAFLISGAQAVLLCAILWVTIIRITHSVAGPAMVLERAVDNLCQGKFDSRLTLRNGDYLKSLAAALKRLTDHLQDQEQARRLAALPEPMSVPPELDREAELAVRE